LSLIELLVVIAIIALLAALASPAVLWSRESSRRLQCQSQMRQIAIALVGSTEAKGAYPNMAVNHRSINVGYVRSWVVETLPWFDQQKLYDAWDQNRFNWQSPNDTLAATPLPLLVCPSDASAIPGKPNLTYVVNGGFGWSGTHVYVGVMRDGIVLPLDLNGNGVFGLADYLGAGGLTEYVLYTRTSVFFLTASPPGPDLLTPKHSPATVVDGLTNTILLGENVRAGYDPTRLAANGWSSSHPWRVAFFVSGYVCKDLSCKEGNVDYAYANKLGELPYSNEAINGSLKLLEGSPWPSSYHGPGVNFAFCDGRVRFISQSISGPVYAALCSPQGSLVAGPLAQMVPSDADY
jgi:prepilin-type processing-associated H-X9-DG protein